MHKLLLFFKSNKKNGGSFKTCMVTLEIFKFDGLNFKAFELILVQLLVTMGT